jgi:universal stress protein E
MNSCPHYVCAIDFTPACRRALREAVRRATLDDTRVTAVHVLDEFLVHELKKALSTTEAAIRTEWEARMQRFVNDTACGGRPVMIELRLGTPHQGILDACHYHATKLLFMGSSGAGDAQHRIGAVAAQCIRQATFPVMVVRENAPEAFHHILACIDFSPSSAAIVQQAIELAKQDAAEVHCLFVHQSALLFAMSDGGFITPTPPLDMDDTLGEHWRHRLDQLVDPLAAANPGVVVKKIFEARMSIREAILDTARGTTADLVVLGTHGGGRLRHFLLGTTAEKIIQHAPCSILAVKSGETPPA